MSNSLMYRMQSVYGGRTLSYHNCVWYKMMSRFCFKVMQKHCCNSVESYNVIFIMLLYVRSIGSLNKATMREREREREKELKIERKGDRRTQEI